MNLLHMKYAVEVANAKSINKAAENLYVGQSALSRAIKELEDSLGTKLFVRSAKGVSLTPDGELFIKSAKSVLDRVDELERTLGKKKADKIRFSISVPRASYISAAFTRFSALIGPDTDAELFYKETNSMRTVQNVVDGEYRLGIVRYAENYDKYYKDMMASKGLKSKVIAEFHYCLVMSENGPLASKEKIAVADLKNLVEIAHADPYVPSISALDLKKSELPEYSSRRIFVFERGSQFDLLVNNRETYMWVSPIPDAMLARYHLVQRECPENSRRYLDVLIYREDLRLSETDRLFLDELEKAKSEFIG